MQNHEVYQKGRHLLLAGVTIGSILEWYEVFSFAYWGPLLYKVFFPNANTQLSGVTYSIIAFSFGFLTRPIGGLIFGNIGDKKGRKNAFVKSIFWAAVPSIAMGALPTYNEAGIISYVLLLSFRLLQGVPAGGELPGAMCYLAEVSHKKNRNYFCSYTFVGAQIGAIIAIGESLFLENYVSEDFLLNGGWRLSFLLAGVIGLIGVLFRRRLDETPFFKHLEKVHHVLRAPVKTAILKHKKQIAMCFLFCTLEVVGYFLIGIYPAVYFEQFFADLGLNNFSITGIVLIFSVISIPMFGKLGDLYDAKKLLQWSSGFIFVMSLVFYYTISSKILLASIFCEFVLIVALNIQFALIPSFVAFMFPTSVRFSCLGLSFNICDSFLGGGVPLLAIYLLRKTGDQGSFLWILAAAAIISFFSFLTSKHHHSHGEAYWQLFPLEKSEQLES